MESNAHKCPQGWKHPDHIDVGGTSFEYILITGEDQEDKDDNNVRKHVYTTD